MVDPMYLAALRRERLGYEKNGRVGRVADVDAEIARVTASDGVPAQDAPSPVEGPEAPSGPVLEDADESAPVERAVPAKRGRPAKGA